MALFLGSPGLGGVPQRSPQRLCDLCPSFSVHLAVWGTAV